MKKNRDLIAAGLLPFLILLVICIDRGIYPFGDSCMLHIDMYHQYCPFFAELMEKLKTQGSLFYSWHVGMGSDFLALYAYYLASPLNWLLVLFPKQYLIEVMTFFVLLKLSLCGVTFAYYLREHHGEALAACSDEKRRVSRAALVLCGTAYALSGFTAAYAWNIMWLDVVVLAPLVLLGVERLAAGESPVLYYVTLAAAILCNYYIGLILCIFVVFWFLLCAPRRIRVWGSFAASSLLAGGTGAVLILPTLAVLNNSGSATESFPDSVKWYFHLIAEWSRSNLMADAYTGREHWPNLYCGVFAVFFLWLFVLTSSGVRERMRIAFCAFVFLGFSNNVLDYIWHGFHFPTALPGRQSFLYIFLVLSLAYEAFLRLDRMKLRQIWCAGIVLFALLFAGYSLETGEGSSAVTGTESFVMTAVWVGIYLVLLSVYLVGTRSLKKGMLFLCGFSIVAELMFNYQVTGLETTSRASYTSDWPDYDALLETADARAGDTFYRAEKTERLTKNDAALLGYASATQFSSLMDIEVSHLYQKVGMEGGKNYYCYNGAGPLFSAMLSVRYLFSDNGAEAGPLATLIDQSGDVYLYENNYVLPLGFVMDDEIVDAWSDVVTTAGSDSTSVITVDGQTVTMRGDIGRMNGLATLLGANNDMLYQVGSYSESGVSTISVEETGYYYATYESTDLENLTMETTGGRSRKYTKVSHNYTLDLGYCEEGEEISIKNTSNEVLRITAYRLDLDAFLAAYETLNQQTMELTSFSDTALTGTIDVKEAGDLILSIEQDDGWRVFVDGEEIEAKSFGGAWIAIPLETGTHEIELSYRSPYFGYGALISIGCIVLFLVWMGMRRIFRIPKR